MKLEEYEFWDKVGATYSEIDTQVFGHTHIIHTEKYNVLIQTVNENVRSLLIQLNMANNITMYFGMYGCPLFDNQLVLELSDQVFDDILTELKDSGAGDLFFCTEQIRGWACGPADFLKPLR